MCDVLDLIDACNILNSAPARRETPDEELDA